MGSYKDLIVWQKSVDLVEEAYRVTSSFPENEKFGLTSQMRRAVVSIPSNIAEGSKRVSRKEYRQFILMAYGSGAELETQFIIMNRLGFRRKENTIKGESLLNEILRMLHVLQLKLRSQ
jgi:four helix bundle protein